MVSLLHQQKIDAGLPESKFAKNNKTIALMKSENEQEKDQWKPLKIAVVVVITFWVINLLFGIISLCAGDVGARLGDSFGIVNALFSSLAVAGALYAVVIQQNEFREARKQAAATEAHQKEVATTQAFSAYIQCLASCAQLTFLKYLDVAQRIQKELGEEPMIPDLENISPSEYEAVTKENAEMLKQRKDNFSKNMGIMLFYNERNHQLLLDLHSALGTIKSFPNVASQLSQASGESSATGQNENADQG